METFHTYGLDRLRQSPPLKPSLVEWKLRCAARDGQRNAALKPSLVEWKPVPGCDLQDDRASLKPSLVEWKQFPDTAMNLA